MGTGEQGENNRHSEAGGKGNITKGGGAGRDVIATIYIDRCTKAGEQQKAGLTSGSLFLPLT